MLRAMQPGVTSFTAVLYGEDYCNSTWTWGYRYGHSAVLTVQGAATAQAVFLPVIKR